MNFGRVKDLKNELSLALGNAVNSALVLIISPVNRFYLSGFSSSAGWIVLFQNERYLFLDQRYYGAALRCVTNFKVVCTKNFFKNLKSMVKKYSIKTIVLEEDYVTLGLANKIKNALEPFACSVNSYQNLSAIISKIRSIKSENEIKNIKKSQEILESGFSHILKFVKPNITEAELATELEFFAKKLGAKSTAFDFIIASGSNSAVPHSSVSNKKINTNDVVLIDIGINFNGYMCDMTRTLFVGSVSPKQAEVYELVLKAQKLAINNIKPGVACNKIDAIVRDFIDSTKYKGMFLHSSGHGVGLEVHERPFVAQKSKDIFSPGMVVTVEPGIYIDGEFGVRIEDMVLVTENGCENLTSVPKNILVL